jgi:hypothetical protein
VGPGVLVTGRNGGGENGLSGPTLMEWDFRSGVCSTGPYLRRKVSRLAPVAPYVAGADSKDPVEKECWMSGEDSGELPVGVEVPISRLRTEILGSMNFVLYSERTWV